MRNYKYVFIKHKFLKYMGYFKDRYNIIFSYIIVLSE